MFDKIVKIKSISQLHPFLGFGKPKHPLISLIDASQTYIPEEGVGIKIIYDFLWFH